MAYTALYRKWRPKTFGDVAGQEHITATLARQVSTGRLSHAYLFTGTRGTGKTTCAKILARAVNCEHPVNGSPCNQCPSCLGIESGAIMDVTEMDAASNNGVDNVRALRDEAIYAPTAVKRRVYIIDEVHMLSGAAFNALLKILEEPPEHLLFILATTELRKVPATILSRCQRFAFRRIPPEVIAQRLQVVAQGEGMQLEPDAAAALARLADGALRDGISLLDQCSVPDVITLERVREAVGDAAGEEIAELFSAVNTGDAVGAVAIAERLFAGGQDMGSMLRQLSALYRDLLLEKLGMGSALMSGGFDREQVAALAASCSKNALLAGAERLSNHLAELERSPDRRLAAELCLLRLAGWRDEGAVIQPVQAAPVQTAPIQAPPVQAQPIKATPVEIPPVQTQVQATPQAPVQPVPPTKSEQPVKPASAQPMGAPSWKDILKLLRGRVSPGDFNLLSDSLLVDGKTEGAHLTVTGKNVFTVMLLKDTALLESVKAAFAELAGTAVTVSVVEGDEAPPAAPDAADKLERLMRLGEDIITVK